jgi:hypothetical protein
MIMTEPIRRHLQWLLVPPWLPTSLQQPSTITRRHLSLPPLPLNGVKSIKKQQQNNDISTWYCSGCLRWIKVFYHSHNNLCWPPSAHLQHLYVLSLLFDHQALTWPIQNNQNFVASTALHMIYLNTLLLCRWLSLRSIDSRYHSENQLLHFTVPLCRYNRFIFEIIMVCSSDCLHFKDQRRIEEDHQRALILDEDAAGLVLFLCDSSIMKFIQLIDWSIQLQSWWQLVVVHYY